MSLYQEGKWESVGTLQKYFMHNIFFRTLFSSFFLSANDMMVAKVLGKLAARRILWKKTQTNGFRGHLEPSLKNNVAHCACIVLLDKDIKQISVVTYYRHNIELLDNIYCCNILCKTKCYFILLHFQNIFCHIFHLGCTAALVLLKIN